jgi:hypothetical protein
VAPLARWLRYNSRVIFGKGKTNLPRTAHTVRDGQEIVGNMPDLSGCLFCHVERSRDISNYSKIKLEIPRLRSE